MVSVAKCKMLNQTYFVRWLDEKVFSSKVIDFSGISSTWRIQRNKVIGIIIPSMWILRGAQILNTKKIRVIRSKTTVIMIAQILSVAAMATKSNVFDKIMLLTVKVIASGDD